MDTHFFIFFLYKSEFRIIYLFIFFFTIELILINFKNPILINRYKRNFFYGFTTKNWILLKKKKRGFKKFFFILDLTDISLNLYQWYNACLYLCYVYRN